jgi:hypothetical protein
MLARWNSVRVLLVVDANDDYTSSIYWMNTEYFIIAMAYVTIRGYGIIMRELTIWQLTPSVRNLNAELRLGSMEGATGIGCSNIEDAKTHHDRSILPYNQR